MTKYKVMLTGKERQQLRDMFRAGKQAVKTLTHALILLKADAAEGGPAWPDQRIAEAIEVSSDTVVRVRRRFVEEGLEAALVRKQQAQPSRARALDGRAEASLIDLAYSTPPPGRAVWTVRLLRDRLVELGIVAAVSRETVRRVLKCRTQRAHQGTEAHRLAAGQQP